jgi:D-aminopeptidase
VLVGHTTIIDGAGEHAVRTGITAVLPRGHRDSTCFAGIFSLNGAGEMTGSQWVDESGMLYGPVMITNTHSVGVVRDATIKWQKQFHPGSWFGLPVVAETFDGFLSDIDGHHVREEHAWAAIDGAKAGHVEEGCVGGGTGMLTARFKGGIGTASRTVESSPNDTFTVGK